MTVSLRKEILPGTWRSLGLIHGPVDVGQIPVGGKSAAAIRAIVGGRCHPAGAARLEDAFVIELSDGRRLLYVNPEFRDYRNLAERVFADPPPFRVDYDHALAKKLAEDRYKYVLLLRVPYRINRSHGSYEGRIKVAGPVGAVAFVDRRILDKWLSRRPKLFTNRNPRAPYLADARPDGGFTLKQLGRLAFALGWSEAARPAAPLSPHSSILVRAAS